MKTRDCVSERAVRPCEWIQGMSEGGDEPDSEDAESRDKQDEMAADVEDDVDEDGEQAEAGKRKGKKL